MLTVRHSHLAVAGIVALTGLGPFRSDLAAGASVGCQQGRATAHQLVWVDREGKAETTIGEPKGVILGPVFSPDGSQIVTWESVGENLDIYRRSVNGEEVVRVTQHSTTDTHPAWFSKSDGIVFATYRNGNADLYVKRTRSERPEPIVTGPLNEYYPDWSPDDSTLVYHVWNPETDERDIRKWDIRTGASTSFVAGPAQEALGQVSPDGSMLAYQSNKTGDWQIFVVPFPEGGDEIQVSVDGGIWPRWADEGELFFVSERRMLVTTVRRGESIGASPPRHVWFVMDVGMKDPMPDADPFQLFSPTYDVSPDGEGFVIVREVDPTSPEEHQSSGSVGSKMPPACIKIR